jgi:hypothetical protein
MQESFERHHCGLNEIALKWHYDLDTGVTKLLKALAIDTRIRVTDRAHNSSHLCGDQRVGARPRVVGV